MRRILSITLLILITFSNTWGAITITLPYTNDFNEDSDLTNITWNQNSTGALARGESGWSGSCLEITPPTTGQTHVGVGAFHGLSTTDLYIRMLVKVGDTLYSTASSIGYGNQDKFMIISRSTGEADDRAMVMLEATAGAYYAWAACAPDNTCYYDDGQGTWDASGSNEWAKFPPDDEWICLEAHVQVGGATTVTLTKADGSTKSWNSGGNNTSGGTWANVYIIGGFWNGNHSTDADNHIYIDELVIDDEPIGVPAGFLSPPSTPSLHGVSLHGVDMH